MDSAGCPCLTSHCKSPCGICNLSQYWGLWYNNSLILSFLQPTAPMYHFFCHQQELERDFSHKGLYQNDRHKHTAQSDSWWAVGLQRERVERTCRHPQEERRCWAMFLAQVRSRAGNRTGFPHVLGPCSGSDYFNLGASWPWYPPAHEQKVQSFLCIIGVLLLTKANQAADWKSRADTVMNALWGRGWSCVMKYVNSSHNKNNKGKTWQGGGIHLSEGELAVPVPTGWAARVPRGWPATHHRHRA